MTLEEAEGLKPGDKVTRNGEAGTVQSLSNGVHGQGLMVHVEWASGRLGAVGYREAERVTA